MVLKLNCNPKNNKLNIDDKPLKKNKLLRDDLINFNLLMSLPITCDLKPIEIKNHNAIKRSFTKVHFVNVYASII